MTEKQQNLFIYGSLRDRNIFKSVGGLSYTRKRGRVNHETLYAEPAFLADYRKVSPDNVYFYAVKDRTSRIEGLLIYDIPARAMAEIDSYEGKRYDRQTVYVNTSAGGVKAQAYLASQENMERHFGDRFHVNLIHELWLRKRIDKFIKKHTRPGERTTDAELERKAERELLAITERDLVISHYRSDAVSDYFLQHELERPRPSIKHLLDDAGAGPYINNYLALVVKQVLLNQLDDMVLSAYRFELEHMRTSERYYKRAVSLLVALQIINNNSRPVEMIITQAIETMPFQKHDLIDYVKYAVRAARSFFDRRVVTALLGRIGSNFQPGLVPLGAEIELSNVGAAAVEPQKSEQKAVDAVYEGFRYFCDFCLDILTWKLGGYVDDHTGSGDCRGRQGFLEMAPGRLNITGELSRPLTADPWLLNQLIHEIVSFYDVAAHSLHLSFQLRKRQIGRQRILPLGFVKCLLVLGGGLSHKQAGRLWVSRLGRDEITTDHYGEELVFARTTKRKWYLSKGEIAEKPPKQAENYVQQYKFIRLDKKTDYEPLILCLKGLQLAYNPADYLTAEQLASSAKLRGDYEQLKDWAAAPTQISQHTISDFLNIIQAGLMNEGHRRPVHRLHYIDWALGVIGVQLRTFNNQLSKFQRPES